MQNSAVEVATGVWDGSDVCCIVVPRSCHCNGVAVHLDKILASDKILIQQYEPTETTANDALEAMNECVGPETSVLEYSPAEAPEPTVETQAARRKLLREAESICIWTPEDACLLVFPSGVDDILPSQIRPILAACKTLWIAQYDLSVRTLRDILLTLTSNDPTKCPQDFSIINMAAS